LENKKELEIGRRGRSPGKVSNKESLLGMKGNSNNPPWKSFFQV